MRIPILGAILLIIITITVNLYIISDIKKYCVSRYKGFIKTGYDILATVFLGWVIVVIILPKRSADESILALMWMLFGILTVLMSQIIYVLASITGRVIVHLRKRGQNRGIIIGIILAVLTFIIMWWGALFTRYDIEVQNLEISSKKLPQSFDGFKIVQFSDAHVGTWGNDTTFISNLVDSINNLKPDVIVFTGDVVNRRSSEFDPFKNVFKRLSAPHGVYAILGNHDYAGYVNWEHKGDANKDVARLVSEMSSIGWKVLANKSDFIHIGNDSIVITGVENWGEPPFNRLGNLIKSYPNSKDHDKRHGLNDNHFKVLLTHNPAHWSKVAVNISNYDLTLSGHTHAMQLLVKVGNWKWSPAVFRYKTWGGLYNSKAKDGTPMNLYVNIGAGEVGFPARLLGAKPEITNITLKSE